MGRIGWTFVSILLCGSLLAAEYFHSWYPLLQHASKLDKASAIVLLAGACEERTPRAASLYHAKYAPIILLTNDGVRRGWSREHDRNLYSIEMSEIELVRRGVPLQSIVKLPYRRSGTVYDAMAVRDYLVQKKMDSIIIVTSDYHSSRALWIFEQVLRKIPHRINFVEVESSKLSVIAFLQEFSKGVYFFLQFYVFGAAF